jgi:RNA polymerase sigma-70 factor (ECF subfamily)
LAHFYREIEAEIPRLRRYARALARDVMTADDLVQECLTRALDKSRLWEQGTDLRAWLFTILHNQYVNHVRRSLREGVAVRLSEREPLLTRVPQQGEWLELRDVERAIAKLPEAQRSVILLVGLEGMRYEEVAAILDVPVGTIRSRLSRGRDALRRLTGAVQSGGRGHDGRPKRSWPRRPAVRQTESRSGTAGGRCGLAPGRLAGGSGQHSPRLRHPAAHGDRAA